MVVEIPLTKKNGRSAGRKLVILNQESKVRIVHEYEGGRVEATHISQADLPIKIEDATGIVYCIIKASPLSPSVFDV